MRAGLLRHSISIVAPGSAKDSFGQNVAGPPTRVLECNAAINALTGREVYALGAGFTGQLTHKIVIRKPAVTIAAGMTVLFGSRTFKVQLPPADPDERGRELDLICLEQSQ